VYQLYVKTRALGESRPPPKQIRSPYYLSSGWLLRSTVGGTPVFGRRTDPVLRSTFSWHVTTMWVNRPLKIGQLGQLSLSSFRGRCKLQLDVCHFNQRRRHLMNAYEVKAGMVFIAGKTVWSMPERFKVVCIPCKALYKCSLLCFFYLDPDPESK